MPFRTPPRGLLTTPLALAEGSTQRYVATPGDVVVLCSAAGETVNPGGACFDISGWAAMGIELTDDSGLPVAAALSFENAAGATIGSTVVCSQGALRIPSGATHLFVSVGQAVGPLACGIGTGPGTAGTIEIWRSIGVCC